jgi:hypothetical protein
MGPVKKAPGGVLHMIVEKDARQLAGGVNVVVNEPTDILGEFAFRVLDGGTGCLSLTLLQRGKLATCRLRR